jgi:hypothetical protein
MSADPWAFWQPGDIARVTGCPVDAVRTNWPLIVAALDARGIYDRDVCLGVLPTIAIETASTFTPLHEYGTPADWAGYEGGAAYAGRGFIQLTHLSNYRAAGAALGLDLAGNPDLALSPEVAAGVMAWFWATKGVSAKSGGHFYSLTELCHQHDWEWVRRVVQGGTAGLDRLIAMASALDSYKEPAPMPKIVFDPTYPAVLQDDDWSCAPTALTWAFRAIGRTPATNWIEGDMLARGLVSRADGLLDRSGAGIVRWIEIDDAEHYGSDGYTANNQFGITWDQLVPEIDPHAPYPMLLGLPNWNLAGEGHWVGIRGFGGGRIQLANPDTGATFGQSSLSRSEFDLRQGSGATIVRVLHKDLLAPATPTDPVPPKIDDRISRARAKLSEALAILDEAV